MERWRGCCGSWCWDEELTHLWVPTPYTLSPSLLLTRDTPGLTAPMSALPFKCVFPLSHGNHQFSFTFSDPLKLWFNPTFFDYLYAFHELLILLLTWNLFCGIQHNWNMGAQGSISAAAVYVSLWWGGSVILPYLFFMMSSVQCKVSKIRNNPSLGICFDAKWNLPFLKTTSFGSISEIGCPLLVVSVTPLFTAHSHLLPLCWTCQSFW